MVRRGTKTPAGWALLALAVAMSACSASAAPNGGGGVELVRAGRLTVCTHLDYPPFQARHGDQVVGFDVDVADEIARDLGVTQEIADVPFESLESGESLSNRQCDLVAAAMTITPKRRETLGLSEPYFKVRHALVTRRRSGLGGLASLRGKRLGTLLASGGDEFAEASKAANGYEIVPFDDVSVLVDAVNHGYVAAAIHDHRVLVSEIADHPELELSAPLDIGEHYGIAVSKGNTSLLARINATLARLRADGGYDVIHERWFGTKPV